MSYSLKIVNQVRTLRKKGFSIRELARKIGSSPDTVSHWVKNVQLNNDAQTVLLQKRKAAQEKGLAVVKNNREKERIQITKTAYELVNKIILSRDLAKLCCSLIYWCEGSKDTSSVRFTNSNPKLIRLFIDLLRKGYKVDEKKFRGLVHIHEYHDDAVQKKYWSNISGIPVGQFIKSYIKPHTAKNQRESYPGCLAVYYYDAKLAKELTAIYNTFTNRGVSQRQAGTLQKFT